MLTIALGGVAAARPTLRVAPSRATHAIYDWLEERERDVYPTMEGYSGAQQVTRDRMTAPTTPATDSRCGAAASVPASRAVARS